MPLKHLTYKDIDFEKWDKCILDANNGLIYSLSWYLDLVCDEWDALVMDDYRAVMPLPWKKKAGIYYAYPPFFTQQLGITACSPLDFQIETEFLKAIPAKFKLVEYCFNKTNTIQGSQPFNNYELELIRKYADIKKAYSENLKRNLKKSDKFGLKVKPGVSPDEIIRLFRNNQADKAKHWGEKEYRRLSRLLYSCLHSGHGEISAVFNKENELCAGAFFLIFKSRITFIFSGSSDMGRMSKALPFLLDKTIEKYAGKTLILDFEGSNSPNLARFYKGFGAEEFHYPFYRANNLPFPYKQIFSLRKRS